MISRRALLSASSREFGLSKTIANAYKQNNILQNLGHIILLLHSQDWIIGLTKLFHFVSATASNEMSRECRWANAITFDEDLISQSFSINQTWWAPCCTILSKVSLKSAFLFLFLHPLLVKTCFAFFFEDTDLLFGPFVFWYHHCSLNCFPVGSIPFSDCFTVGSIPHFHISYASILPWHLLRGYRSPMMLNDERVE